MVYNNLITCPNQQRLPKKMEQEKKIRREIANCNERRRMQSINAGFNSLKAMLPKHDNEKLSKASILQQTAEYLQLLEQEKTCYLQELNDIKKLLNPELLELHLKRVQETESKLIDQQPTLKRMKVEVSSLDFSNSESSDEGIQISNSSPKRESHDPQWNGNSYVNGQTTGIVNSVDIKLGILSDIVKNGCSSTAANDTNNRTIQPSQLTANSNQIQLLGIVDSDDIDIMRAELVQVRKVLDKERKLRMKLEEQMRDLEAQLYPSRIKEIVQQFQTTGVNIFHQQPLQQVKNNETDLAVSSVIIEQQPVAETVEIETQNCSEFISHLQGTNAANLLTTNQPVQITSSNANFINKSSNVKTIPSTTATLHIIQDLSLNTTLLDTTNFFKPSSLQFDEETNKILTSTAFLTTTTANTTTINKSTKTKNSLATSKDKNTVSAIKQPKVSSHITNSLTNETRDTTNQQPNTQSVVLSQSSTGTFKGHHLTSKKSVCAPPSSTTNQPSELSNGKPDKTKKAKASATIAVEQPILFNSNSTLESNPNDKLANQHSTVAVQLIDSNITSSIDKFEATSATNSAGRNNNLDTIVEAIRHLEGGDVFGSKEVASAVSAIFDDKKQLSFSKTKHDNQELSDKLRFVSKSNDSNDLKQTELKEEGIRKIPRPGVIVSSTNS